MNKMATRAKKKKKKKKKKKSLPVLSVERCGAVVKRRTRDR